MASVWMYLIAGVSAIAIGAGGMHYADSVYYNGKITQMERDDVRADKARTDAELKQLQDINKQIGEAAQIFLKNQGLLGTQFETITKDLQNVQAKTPLPRDCKPTVDRVRNLSAAIDAANNTILGH